MAIEITKYRNGTPTIKVTMNHRKEKFMRYFPVTKEGMVQAKKVDEGYKKMKEDLVSGYQDYSFRNKDGIIKGVYFRSFKNKYSSSIQIRLRPKYNKRIIMDEHMTVFNERHLIQILSEYCNKMKRIVISNSPPDGLEWFIIDQQNIEHFTSLYRDKATELIGGPNGDLFQEFKRSAAGT